VAPVYIPVGQWGLARPLKIYSRTRLLGDGPATALVALPNFDGDSLIVGTDEGIPGDWPAIELAQIADMSFRTMGPRVAAFRPARQDLNVLGCRFERLYLYTPYGLRLDGYTQSCRRAA
jgi:hypothetical protein